MNDLEAAARAVADAWRVPGPRPDIHAAAQVRLRREWPALAQAVTRLAAAVGDAPDGKALSSDELHVISERYRTSPWTLPPALRHLHDPGA